MSCRSILAFWYCKECGTYLGPVVDDEISCHCVDYYDFIFVNILCHPDNCPQCNSPTGIKYPRGYPKYCEDCGWPDEDFDA